MTEKGRRIIGFRGLFCIIVVGIDPNTAYD